MRPEGCRSQPREVADAEQPAGPGLLGELPVPAEQQGRNQRRLHSARELLVEQVGEHAYAGWREPDTATRVDLFRVLESLTAIDRAVVVLRYWDDLGVAETATLLGLSPSAVRVRSHRTLARLRQTLAALNDYDTSGRRP